MISDSEFLSKNQHAYILTIVLYEIMNSSSCPIQTFGNKPVTSNIAARMKRTSLYHHAWNLFGPNTVVKNIAFTCLQHGKYLEIGASRNSVLYVNLYI